MHTRAHVHEEHIYTSVPLISRGDKVEHWQPFLIAHACNRTSAIWPSVETPLEQRYLEFTERNGNSVQV